MTEYDFNKDRKAIQKELDGLTKVAGETDSQAEERKKKREVLLEKYEQLKLDYIKANQPCPTDAHVKIIDWFGRKLQGVAKELKLWDGKVYISAFKDGSQMRYLSKPHGKVEVIKTQI